MSSDIENFIERKNAMDLHDNFFDPYSETEVSFLLEYVNFYGLLSAKKYDKLAKFLTEIEQNSWSTIKKFDNLKLKQWKKL